jgi:hypothetical protein
MIKYKYSCVLRQSEENYKNAVKFAKIVELPVSDPLLAALVNLAYDVILNTIHICISLFYNGVDTIGPPTHI